MVVNNKEITSENKIKTIIDSISNDNKLKFIVLIVVFSYFYNLPFIKYNAIGNNEFRIYDVFGLSILYYFYKYNNFLKFIIKIIKPFNWLWMFMLYGSFMVLVTLFFFIYNDSAKYFFQTILYLYHFYVFFLTSVILYILCYKKSNLKFYLNLILLFSACSCIVVILQNFYILPFLWNEVYLVDYKGFLSGTLGPNKIVLGMTSLIMFILSIGLFIEKNLNINKNLILITILLNVYIILISGSRTTYLGLLVFLLFFAVFKTSKFILFGIVFVTISLTVSVLNDDIYTKVEQVVNQRVIGKVRNKNDLSNQKAEDLYEDLGSGRDQLSKSNAYFLLENPAIIPFGVGFNNWTVRGQGLSAHNMYLQVIKELGIVGFVLYFGWLIQYLFIDFKSFKGFSLAIKGLVLSMLVTLFFGEHLYIYRPIFALLGLFLTVTALFISILHKNEKDN